MDVRDQGLKIKDYCAFTEKWDIGKEIEKF